jgi:hypothetical protein
VAWPKLGSHYLHSGLDDFQWPQTSWPALGGFTTKLVLSGQENNSCSSLTLQPPHAPRQPAPLGLGVSLLQNAFWGTTQFLRRLQQQNHFQPAWWGWKTLFAFSLIHPPQPLSSSISASVGHAAGFLPTPSQGFRTKNKGPVSPAIQSCVMDPPPSVHLVLCSLSQDPHICNSQ